MRKTRKNAAASTLGIRKQTLRSLSTDQLANAEGGSSGHQGQLTWGNHFTDPTPSAVTITLGK
jgi:hypothetical protein